MGGMVVIDGFAKIAALTVPGVFARMMAGGLIPEAEVDCLRDRVGVSVEVDEPSAVR